MASPVSSLCIRESSDNLVRTKLLNSQTPTPESSQSSGSSISEFSRFLVTVTLENYTLAQAQIRHDIKHYKSSEDKTTADKKIEKLLTKQKVLKEHFSAILFDAIIFDTIPKIARTYNYNDAELSLEDMRLPILKSLPRPDGLEVVFVAVKINHISQVLKLFLINNTVHKQSNAFIPAHMDNEVTLIPVINMRKVELNSYNIIRNLFRYYSLSITYTTDELNKDKNQDYIPWTLQIIEPVSKKPLTSKFYDMVLDTHPS